MSTQVTQLALPFSVLSTNRKEPFTREIEQAAIFCIAELEREKGGGLILKQPPEKIAFLAEACYPFWLVPWDELTLAFDGLNAAIRTLAYKRIPDVKSFIENVEQRSKTLETYMTFLSDDVNYFQAPSGEKSIALNGLITDQGFLNEFSLYLIEAKRVTLPPSDAIALPTALNEPALSSMKEELENLKSVFKEDAEVLYASMKQLHKTTDDFVKDLQAKVKMIQEEYGEEIKKQEKITIPEVKKIREEYDEAITQISKKNEKQLLPLQKEKVKLEKTAEQTQNKIEHYRIEAKMCSAKKDAVGERKWKEKINEGKDRLSQLKKAIREAETRIKEQEERKTLEIFKLRSESEAKINEARKGILELESSRDAKIQAYKQETEKLKALTDTIIAQISATAKLRESNIAELGKLGIQQKRKDHDLVYIPFYVVCYLSEKKKRYMIIPPSTVESVGFSVKLKGALGKAKVKQVLEPRFKAITSFLNRLQPLSEKNAVLEREMVEAGEKANILRSPVREQLGSGLRQLKEEGWLSEKEFEAFNQKLV